MAHASGSTEAWEPLDKSGSSERHQFKDATVADPPTTSLHTTNPFSTRFIKPGAAPYLFPRGESAGQLLVRLKRCGWWGEIVGPHGSGKSTLLKLLCGQLKAGGLHVVPVTIAAGLPFDLTPVWQCTSGPAMIVIDGFEQLNAWQRWGVRRHCRRQRLGLLVTCHRTTGLPSLHRTCPTAQVAIALVGRLTAADPGVISPAEVTAAFHAKNGNLREALFQLYDLYEERRSLR